MDSNVLRDLFRDSGAIEVRRMFGGAGVFVDGLMIALVARDVIYLKADGKTIPAFEAEGLSAFRYDTKNGAHTLTSYWRMPERLYDEPEELARWAREAHAVALRAQTKAPKRSRKGGSGKTTSGAAKARKKTVRKSTNLRRRASRKPKSRPRGRSRR